MLALVDVVEFCDGVEHGCVLCVWWSDVLILYVGRMDARLLWWLARRVTSTQLACWRANSTLVSIFKIR